MSKFQIVLIRPEGFLDSEAFREVAETLQFGLRSLGHTAEIRENCFEASATNVILGAHLLSPAHVPIIPPGSIVYNLEQMGRGDLPRSSHELAARHQIWDYCQGNLDIWKRMPCAFSPVKVEVGYVPELRRIAKLPSSLQDIDVLFYGSANERRKRIVENLRSAGVKVHAVYGVYGRERDELIARSKIVLNVHYWESKLFEIVRISYLLANSKAVVSETSEDDLENDYGGAILSLPYGSLVEGCLHLLQSADECRELGHRGFQCFSQRQEGEILQRALAGTHRAAVPARSQSGEVKAVTSNAIIPRKLNLGSGKDWREDCFNVDCNSYWRPDAVLDFNHALPVGQSIESPRYGAVALQNGTFDEIIANDSLEHVANLTTAMTSCLNLLVPGGMFRIAVPYDLSWGAWQDPTHVRAFNERSWLYYTDWFWYLGWTEARFELVQFELVLSPVGEKLKLQGLPNEELIRQPRAVDQLRVTLRKRLLTAEEKRLVEGYLARPERSAGEHCPVDTLIAMSSGFRPSMMESGCKL
jgi:SAM-dependent methyltransferase